VLLQADVNDNDEEDEDHNDEEPKATSEPKSDEKTSLVPESPQKLYPTAPQLDESDESTASAHSTEV